jgi:hypothetical protein
LEVIDAANGDNDLGHPLPQNLNHAPGKAQMFNVAASSRIFLIGG